MDPNTIPNTAAYLYLGLAAIATITGLFITSLVIRVTRLRSELKMIEQVEQESSESISRSGVQFLDDDR